MAVEIGTASDARDLLSKLEKFLTTNPDLVRDKQAWEVIRDSDGGMNIATVDAIDGLDRDRNDGYAYRLRFIGHGLDGEDTVIVPMSLYINTIYKVSSLCAWYASPTDSDKEIAKHFAKMRLALPFTAIPLRDGPMPYWFVANGRRFVLVVKVLENYLSMYCGFMLQFGTDLENPYPMYIGGGHNNNYARIIKNAERTSNRGDDDEERTDHDDVDNEGLINTVDYDYGGFHDPFTIMDSFGALGGDTSSCFCNTPDNTLAMLSQGYGGDEVITNFVKYANGFLLPYSYTGANTVAYDRTREGNYLLSPIEIFIVPKEDNKVGFPIGWLHGAYFVSGKDNVPEKELRIGNKRYLCFPSMKNKLSGWFALLME